MQGGEHLGDEAAVGGACLGGVRAERGADDDEVIDLRERVEMATNPPQHRSPLITRGGESVRL